MESTSSFESMVARLRAGEPDAVRDFVATYEPFIRRTIRRRLIGTPLQAVADSVDICQSALGSFLIRAAAGEFEFETPLDLEKLLLTIARRKLAALARRESAECRDRRRLRGIDSKVRDTDSKLDPGRALAEGDLLDHVEQSLTADARQLFQLRRQGLDWEHIGQQVGEAPVLLRKRLSRALLQARIELGIDDDDA
jgi:DNA-directed RNA polymerase specialized sigma24 family protein